MLGRLFSKLFGGKDATHSGAASRPVSPPRPVPAAAPPPPPPPPRGYGSEAAPARSVETSKDEAKGVSLQEGASQAEPGVPLAEGPPEEPSRGFPDTQPPGAGLDAPADPLDLSQPLVSDVLDVGSTEGQAFPAAEPGDAGGVRLILEDGTLAKPSLDPELEERLRYIVDNIVPPSDPPSEGRAT